MLPPARVNESGSRISKKKILKPDEIKADAQVIQFSQYPRADINRLTGKYKAIGIHLLGVPSACAGIVGYGLPR